MPNHVTNRLRIIGDEKRIKEVMEFIGTDVERKLARTHDDDEIICISSEGKYGWLNEKDNTFTTRNEDRKLTDPVVGLPDGWEQKWNDAFRIMIDFEKIIPPPDCDAYKDLPDQNTVRDDPNWWYNWNCKNWGSKWGAYDTVSIDDSTIQFDTAWSTPHPVIKVLSEKYPDLKFVVDSIDEGWNFAGTAEFIGGELMNEKIIKCNIENDDFVSLCIDLKGYDPREDQEED